MALIDRLSSLWAVDDSNRLPNDIDLIALVSIGSTKHRLTNGAVATANKALKLRRRYLAPVVYGAFKGNNTTIEEETKLKVFGWQGVYAGKVMSTIEECIAFKAKFPRAKKVVFVTEEAHSRRARMIWKCLWPEAEVYIVSVKLSETVDSESLMWPYRNAWTTLLFQALPTPFYKILCILGPKALKAGSGFHQPTAKN